MNSTSMSIFCRQTMEIIALNRLNRTLLPPISALTVIDGAAHGDCCHGIYNVPLSKSKSL